MHPDKRGLRVESKRRNWRLAREADSLFSRLEASQTIVLLHATHSTAQIYAGIFNSKLTPIDSVREFIENAV